MAVALDAVHARAKMLSAIRAWFAREGFVEVETPVLFRAPGLNPHIREFETRYTDVIDPKATWPMWLRTSPEVFHKRLLADGLRKFYEIGRFFRNGEITDTHNPEFTGLELYEANADYRRVMEITEQVIACAIEAVAGTTKITRRGTAVDVAPPWQRVTVTEAFRREGVALPKDGDLAALRAEAKKAGVETSPDEAWDDLFFRLYLTKVDPDDGRLGGGTPVLLYDYPASMGVMARRRADDPLLAERVEAYIAGLELANGFSELTDPVEQRARFERDRAFIAKRDGVAIESMPLDEEFLEALARMPPSTGIAIGLDRVLMLAMGRETIGEVLPFAQRRPPIRG